MIHYHFISGLPRSGSTLLSAILRQNPRFYAGSTSPVGSLIKVMLNQVSAGSEWGPLVSIEQRRHLLRGILESYYRDQVDKSVIFDTNRLWCSKLPILLDLYPDAKVIACVRNVAWVMDSIERLYRANPYENTRLFNDDVESNTVYNRVETLAQSNRLVGFAWSALKEAVYSEQASALLIVDYDMLVKAPGQVIALIYQFLGEEPYAHDFGNLSFDAPDYDSALGLSGLHRVRPQISYRPRPTLLPPDLFEKYAALSFWNDLRGSRANVITARPPTPEIPALASKDATAAQLLTITDAI